MSDHPNKPPGTDDPAANARVRAMLESPSYRIAEQDRDFIASDAARGPRLELDYLKAETGLAEHGIGHTTVIFGGTRIPHPDAALAHVEAALTVFDPEHMPYDYGTATKLRDRLRARLERL